LQLCGTVRNTTRGVEIEIEGSKAAVSAFAEELFSALPKETVVASIRRESLAPSDRRAFSIVQESIRGPLGAHVPQDRGICEDCAAEVLDQRNRRYQYALTSCTLCGPRYSVIRSMPFEREDTAMAEFALCERCVEEYGQPSDRRFHAQTTACAVCGPRIWATAGRDKFVGPAAIRVAAEALKAGKILALQGLGGYQLLVDATSFAAVERLRQRKRRPAKPLAVMVASLQHAGHLAYFDDVERQAFTSAAAPIVLVRARPNNPLAANVAPHLDVVGLMRPTTPLHVLLSRALNRPLICTSGNLEGEPLEYEIADAEKRLAGIADLWLHHDRPIVRPIDDSVVRVIAGRAVTIRLARGLAPLSLELHAKHPTLAVGAYLKAAAAWSSGAQSVLGPHVGDLETMAARERFLEHITDLQRLYRFDPREIVHDMHPEYFSTAWAQSQSLPAVPVQHHHAHVAAGMLEHGLLDQRVLGIAWDGTGYGTDGTVWGGEFLISTASEFSRAARLRPFRLPGGENAIREPWRTAVSICHQLDGSAETLKCPIAWGLSAERLATIIAISTHPQLSPLTSSAGRLFDAAAALILGMVRTDFDGQAAMRLEAVADRSSRGHYEFPLREGLLPEIDWRPLFEQLIADLRRGTEPGVTSMRFHRSLAHGIAAVCRRHAGLPSVLSGGVFQNKLLTELVAEIGDAEGYRLHFPGTIPPNDGGVAAGQLAIASALKG
jgi:hydrogenase maturation protein HypF